VGIYSHLKGTLPAAPTDPSKQDKINIVRAKIKCKGNLSDLGVQFDEWYKRKKQLEEQVSAADTELQAYEQEIVELLESSGLTQFRLDNGTSLSIKDTPYTQVVDKAAWMEYVRANNLEDLLSVNYQTMSGMVNQMLKVGKPTPPGLQATMKQSIHRTPPREPRST
jgi:hypothetical protein